MQVVEEKVEEGVAVVVEVGEEEVLLWAGSEGPAVPGRVPGLGWASPNPNQVRWSSSAYPYVSPWTRVSAT